MKNTKWAAFGLVKDSVGKIIGKIGNEYLIEYCEGQMYDPALWSASSVKVFNTPEKAIDFATKRSTESHWELVEIFERDFPSERLK